MALRRPGIPAIDPNWPQTLQAFLAPLKESIEISNGVRASGQQQGAGVGYDGWKRRSFTIGMAIRCGLITEAQASQLFNNEP